MTEDSTLREQWDGPFDSQAYAVARDILGEDHDRASAQIKSIMRRRALVVALVAAVWAACSVALAFANTELLLFAEIGWVVVVVWAVFWILPTVMGRANLDEVYAQYDAQLIKLEKAGIAMPTPASIEDLVAAIDLVSPPEA